MTEDEIKEKFNFNYFDKQAAKLQKRLDSINDSKRKILENPEKYLKRQKIALALLIVFSISTLGFLVWLIFYAPPPSWERNPKMSDYDYAVYKVEDTQKALKTLNDYIETQKKQIESTKQVFSELSSKKKAVETVISLNKEQVEAFASIMGERSQKGRLSDFLLGVISSIAATLLLTRGSKLIEAIRLGRNVKKQHEALRILSDAKKSEASSSAQS